MASDPLREPLLGRAPPWDRRRGPRAIEACPPTERHDSALICVGIVLRPSGWRVTFLGADALKGTVAEAADAIELEAVGLHPSWTDRREVNFVVGVSAHIGHGLRTALLGTATQAIDGAPGTVVVDAKGQIEAQLLILWVG